MLQPFFTTADQLHQGDKTSHRAVMAIKGRTKILKKLLIVAGKPSGWADISQPQNTFRHRDHPKSLAQAIPDKHGVFTGSKHGSATEQQIE